MERGSQLSYTTVRIQGLNKDAQSVGTGFLYSEPYPPKEGYLLNIVVTCKHVITGTQSGCIYFHLRDPNEKPVKPLNKSKGIIFKDWNSRWFQHPDPNVDLCCMPITDVPGLLLKMNMKMYQVAFGPNHLPSHEQLARMDTIEEVLMVGYPTGIWDEVHNYPLIRKGITSTHPAINFNNRQEFVVDMACLPGSSGSPVIRISKDGDDPPGDNLLGVLYGGPFHDAKGGIILPGDESDGTSIETRTRIPTHLGFVINAAAVRNLVDEAIAGAEDSKNEKFKIM